MNFQINFVDGEKLLAVFVLFQKLKFYDTFIKKKCFVYLQKEVLNKNGKKGKEKSQEVFEEKGFKKEKEKKIVTQLFLFFIFVIYFNIF
jgi:hypothetical protein